MNCIAVAASLMWRPCACLCMRSIAISLKINETLVFSR